MKTNFTYSLAVWFWFFYSLPGKGTAQTYVDPANVIYGLTNAGNIRAVHVNNAAVDSPFAAPAFTGSGFRSSDAMGYNPLYKDFDYFSVKDSSQEFVEFNPVAGTIQKLRPIPNYTGVVSSCENATGSRFYCLDGGYQLCYYNVFNDNWTMLTSDFVDQFGNDVTGVFQSMTGGDMAMDGSGNLWIIVSSDNMYALYLITTNDLPFNTVASVAVDEIIPPTAASFSGGAFDGIAFDDSGHIYLSTKTCLFLLHDDWSTITCLGSFGLSSGEAMTDLTSGNFPKVMLPKIWRNFVVSTQEEGRVALGWQYGQPVNSGVYSIQRSVNCETWTEIGSKQVLNGDSIVAYTFTDAYSPVDMAYYRIRLRMPNEPDTYSGIRVIDARDSAAFTLSPDPVRNAMIIQNYEMGPGGWIVVYDLRGRTMIVNRLSPGANVISTSALVPGVYVAEVTASDGQVHTQKIVKQ